MVILGAAAGCRDGGSLSAVLRSGGPGVIGGQGANWRRASANDGVGDRGLGACRPGPPSLSPFSSAARR